MSCGDLQLTDASCRRASGCGTTRVPTVDSVLQAARSRDAWVFPRPCGRAGLSRAEKERAGTKLPGGHPGSGPRRRASAAPQSEAVEAGTLHRLGRCPPETRSRTRPCVGARPEPFRGEGPDTRSWTPAASDHRPALESPDQGSREVRRPAGPVLHRQVDPHDRDPSCLRRFRPIERTWVRTGVRAGSYDRFRLSIVGSSEAACWSRCHPQERGFFGGGAIPVS